MVGDLRRGRGLAVVAEPMVVVVSELGSRGTAGQQLAWITDRATS
jgi:hypothetical protein